VLQEQRKHSLGLSQSDIDIAVATIPGITGYSAERKIETHSLYSHYGKSDGSAIGISPSYMQLSKLQFAAGRHFTEQENLYAAQVAILGARVAQSLFPEGDALGKPVKVNHVWLQV